MLNAVNILLSHTDGLVTYWDHSATTDFLPILAMTHTLSKQNKDFSNTHGLMN